MTASNEEAVVVVSKPGQILMALSALHELDRRATFFVVVRSFGDLDSFLALLNGHPEAARISTLLRVNDYYELSKYKGQISGKDLFVEDDRVSLYLVFKSLDPRELHVFEEGLGTYDPNYWTRRLGIRHRLKALKWKLIGGLRGSGLNIGEGRSTIAVHCTRPDLYRLRHPKLAHKAKAITGYGLFHQHFEKHLERDFHLLCSPKQDAVLYLTGWSLRSLKEIAMYAEETNSCLFIKPHPHIQRRKDWLGNSANVPHHIPAEFTINYLTKKFRNVRVIHEASAACILYPFNTQKIRFKTLAEPAFYKRYIDEGHIAPPLYSSFRGLAAPKSQNEGSSS